MLKFTPEQKIILAMIADLSKPASSREIDPQFVLKAVINGHPWAIQWEYGGLLPDEDDTKEELHFVLDVVDMWSFIEDAWRHYGEQARNEVHSGIAHLGNGPAFWGFDGNNEAKYLSIARFLIEDMNRFAEFKGRELNSHVPKVERYRKMLTVFSKIRPNISGRRMQAEEMIAVLSRE